MDKTIIPAGANCCRKDGKPCPYLEEVKRERVDKSTCIFGNTCKKNCDKEQCYEIITRCNYLGVSEVLSKGQLMLFAKVKLCGENLYE